MKSLEKEKDVVNISEDPIKLCSQLITRIYIYYIRRKILSRSNQKKNRNPNLWRKSSRSRKQTQRKSVGRKR
jgi:hypothetical protein